MPLLSKDQILSASDLPTRDVSVPEWGGTVRVRTLNGAERDAWEASIVADREKQSIANVRAKFAALVIVDEQGNRLFNEYDVSLLARKSSKALSRVLVEGQKLSGLTNDDMEELAKTSGAAQSGGSISDSPSASA